MHRVTPRKSSKIVHPCLNEYIGAPIILSRSTLYRVSIDYGQTPILHPRFIRFGGGFDNLRVGRTATNMFLCWGNTIGIHKI